MLSKLVYSLSLGRKIQLITTATLTACGVAMVLLLYSSHEAIREETELGIKNQVEAAYHLLESIQNSSSNQEEFIAQTRTVLSAMTWGEDKSGYLFLMDRDGKLLIYPPNTAKEGGTSKNQLILKAVSISQPSFVHYMNKKPDTEEKFEKVTYVFPATNKNWVVVGGTYLDKAEQIFQKHVLHALIGLAIILAILIPLIMIIRRKMTHRVKKNHPLFRNDCKAQPHTRP